MRLLSSLCLVVMLLAVAACGSYPTTAPAPAATKACDCKPCTCKDKCACAKCACAKCLGKAAK